MKRITTSSNKRGQAYTLEGFIGAIIVLTAVLFALQSVVITPGTGGAVDRSVQAQLQGEAKDTLVVASNSDELSELVRNWDRGNEKYHNSTVPEGQRDYYYGDRFADPTVMNGIQFGAVLNETFTQSGRNVNVGLVYEDEDGTDNSTDLVYQGRPSPNAFTASYTVTLYDDQRLTAPDNTHLTLADAEDEGYPIPNVDTDDHVYNVVEVRLVVW